MELSKLLHNFGNKPADRRQYRRLALEFAVWWLKDRKANKPVAGIGTEISGGGLRFLLQCQIEDTNCSIALRIHGRRMRANILIIHSAEVMFKGQAWRRYSAKFIGLLSTDFDFIMALTDEQAQPDQAVRAPLCPESNQPTDVTILTNELVEQPVRARIADPEPSILPPAAQFEGSTGSLESYDLLPSPIQEQIVQKLVEMKRYVAPDQLHFTPMATHYGGMQPAPDGTCFHHFFVRTRMNSPAGALVFNTEFLVTDDGTRVSLRE